MESVLLWGGVIAGPLFIAVFVIEGALRKGYNPWRQPVSELSIGPRGWIQQANFFGNSILLLACAVGLHSILIGIYGAGLFGTGVFVTDAESKAARTKHGILHDVFSGLIFASLCIACFVFAGQFAQVGDTGWQLYSIGTGVLYGVGFVLFARGFSLTKGYLYLYGGLLQKLTVALGGIWLSLVAAHMLGVL